MADLNIPKFNMKSEKYIFKKKLSLNRKSKRSLLAESALMFILSIILVSIINLIPNKDVLLQKLPTTFNKSLILINDLFLNLYEIFLGFIIFISSLTALILFIGSLFRVFKVTLRGKNKIIYK